MDNLNLVVSYTPTGMIPTKEMTSHVPVTPAEIVEDVLRANEQGITMTHLHARDPKTGRPTYEGEVYAEIIGGIRKYAPELILCVTTSGRDFNEFEKRAEPLQLTGNLKPDMGSLTLSSLNFNKTASVNAPDTIVRLCAEMNRLSIKPELEAFDSGMINYAHYLIERGMLKPPYYFNLLLGNIACAQADLLHAGIMIRDLPPDSYWSFAGIGQFQLRMNSVAIAMGGGVRVGLEDNIWFDRARSVLATNINLLRRVHTIADSNERTLMRPSEMRRRLNLEDGNGSYGVRGNPTINVMENS